MKLFTETCCDSLERALLARERGTGRIELCENLGVGGTTPGAGLIKTVIDAVSPLPVNVLIRPRGGDFVFTGQELDSMLEDISFCKRAGAHGVVLGALDRKADVDMPAMVRLLEAARPLSVTFHRAFDECRDPLVAFEQICSLGFDRLLTSGHARNAWEGRDLIASLVEKSRGRITVMPGCGVTPENIEALARWTRASEFHGTRL